MSAESRELLREVERLKRAIPRWGVYQFLAFGAFCAALAWLS
jgi:hypothetical protein